MFESIQWGKWRKLNFLELHLQRYTDQIISDKSSVSVLGAVLLMLRCLWGHCLSILAVMFLAIFGLLLCISSVPQSVSMFFLLKIYLKGRVTEWESLRESICLLLNSPKTTTPRAKPGSQTSMFLYQVNVTKTQVLEPSFATSQGIHWLEARWEIEQLGLTWVTLIWATSIPSSILPTVTSLQIFLQNEINP